MLSQSKQKEKTIEFSSSISNRTGKQR